MAYIFCILSSVGVHSDCFMYVLAIVNSAAVNFGLHVPFWIMVFSGHIPIIRLLGHMVVLFLVSKGISILFSTVALSVDIATNTARGISFLHIISGIYCCRFWWWPFWLLWGDNLTVVLFPMSLIMCVWTEVTWPRLGSPVVSWCGACCLLSVLWMNAGAYCSNPGGSVCGEALKSLPAILPLMGLELWVKNDLEN